MFYFSRGTDPHHLYVFSPGGNTEHFTGACTVWTIFYYAGGYGTDYQAGKKPLTAAINYLYTI
jgi:hypothetical protein